MRRTLAPIIALATLVTFAGTADAAEPEPPGTVEVAPASDLPNFSTTTVALSPGRIAWLGAGPAIPVNKRAQSVVTSAVHLGSLSSVGDARYAVAAQPLVFSSGARTLWMSRAGSNSPYQVNLTSGSTTKVISHSGIPLRLSGNRALFQRRSDDHYVVYDIDSGTYLDVTAKYGTRLSSGTPTVDLFGNNLVYVTKGLTVRLKNLSSGAPSVVLAKGGSYNGAYVLAYGDHVAWDQYVHFSDGFDNEDFCRLRNVRTMAPAVTISCARALTSAGVIWQSGSGGSATWKLRSYAGDVATLPVPASTYALTIDGATMAWADTDGLHAVARANASTVRPRSLGNPVTRATYRIGGTTWPFRLVTSAQLTSCSVRITQAGEPVRTLACNSGVTGVGEVLTRWNGKDDQGHYVTPGTYRWTVYAANNGRTLARSDGELKQTSGVVSVIR